MHLRASEDLSLDVGVRQAPHGGHTRAVQRELVLVRQLKSYTQNDAE